MKQTNPAANTLRPFLHVGDPTHELFMAAGKPGTVSQLTPVAPTL